MACSIAQSIQFEQVLPPPPAPQIYAAFESVSYTTIAIADVEGDMDLDLIISGSNGSRYVSNLYLNDGLGNFMLDPNSEIIGVSSATIEFADIDNDQDQDFLLSGWSNESKPVTKLYLNDGAGQFAEKVGTPFQEVSSGAMRFGDVDGDNDQDILISGQYTYGFYSTKLFLNDSLGNFTEVSNTPFEHVGFGSINFADIDGDSDLDVFLTGNKSSQEKIAKLYINDGLGTFTEVTGTPFEGIYESSVDFSDVEGDGDLDLIMAGSNTLNNNITKLFVNDGLGNFTEDTLAKLEGVQKCAVKFGDLDGDLDQDVLICGENNNYQSTTALYLNDGAGLFTLDTINSFVSVRRGAVGFLDIEKDNDLDIILSGEKNIDQLASILYVNENNERFVDVKSSPYVGVFESSAAFADVDGDDDQDMLITGKVSPYLADIQLYINDGLGNYVAKDSFSIEAIHSGTLSFADFDGDGDLDVFITGKHNSNSKSAKIYLNDGSGIFALKSGTPFTSVYRSAVAIGDVDGDNDLDILLTGELSSSVIISKLYKNNGSAGFSLASSSPFDGARQGSVAFSDFDNDSDLDLMIVGNNGSINIADLFVNDGLGNFTKKSGTSFPGLSQSTLKFADVDNDQDEDLFMTGQDSSGLKITKLYKNDGTGVFIEMLNTPFDRVSKGAAAFADIDGDSDFDLILTGENSNTLRISKLYINDGLGNFVQEQNILFKNIENGSIDITDIDGDLDLDLLLTGLIDKGQYAAQIYRNKSCRSMYYVSDDVNVCYGDDYTLPDSSIVTNLTSNMTDTSRFQTNVEGCDSLLITRLNVVSIDNSVIQSGSTLTANIDTLSYQWLDCSNNYVVISGEISPNFQSISNGSFAVEILSYGCKDTSICFPIEITDFHKKDLNKTLIVYPNPTNGKIIIRGGTDKARVQIRILDMFGRVFLKEALVSEKMNELRLPEKKGIYLIEVRSNTNLLKVFKIVKE